MARHKKRAPALPTPRLLDDVNAAKLDASRSTAANCRKQALVVIGEISKGDCCGLRVAVSEWRGDHKVEIAETTKIVGDVYFPGRPVCIDIDHMCQLIALLQKVVQR
jgi:hypothetical protein